MGVLGKGYDLAAVTQQTGHDVQGDTLGESKSGESVAEAVPGYVPNSGQFAVAAKPPGDGIRAHRTTVGEDEDEPAVLPARPEHGPVALLDGPKFDQTTDRPGRQRDCAVAASRLWLGGLEPRPESVTPHGKSLVLEVDIGPEKPGYYTDSQSDTTTSQSVT